jgi:sec-independent protein translocase protein TatC
MAANSSDEMGFFEHLEVLRWHLIRCFVAIAFFAVVFFLNSHFVFDSLLFGPTRDSFVTYRWLCLLSKKFTLPESLCISGAKIQLMNTEIFGQFITQLKTAFVLGFVVSFPYIIFEIWKFVRPALTEREAKSARIVIISSSFFFFLGLVFSYFILVPFSINFAMNYIVSQQIDNRITLDNYISFFTMMSLAMGIVFELPMIAIALARLGLLSAQTMRQFRRHAIIVILIIAAIITPSPDVFTQMLVAIPMYFLFELSIIVAARVEKTS